MFNKTYKLTLREIKFIAQGVDSEVIKEGTKIRVTNGLKIDIVSVENITDEARQTAFWNGLFLGAWIGWFALMIIALLFAK